LYQQTTTNKLKREKPAKASYKMKKIIAISALLICTTLATRAQSVNSSASQTIQLELSDAIEIGFVATGNNTGSVVNLAFSNVNDYANGIESAEYQVRIRSNKDFDVHMEANADYFTYSGATSPAPSMKVKDVLDMMITSNSTGGQINGGYHHFKHVDGDHSKRIINNGDRGGNQTFAVKYKATPGFEYPAGTYTINMVYTATHD
jgi:hypothetical protein